MAFAMINLSYEDEAVNKPIFHNHFFIKSADSVHALEILGKMYVGAFPLCSWRPPWRILDPPLSRLLYAIVAL